MMHFTSKGIKPFIHIGIFITFFLPLVSFAQEGDSPHNLRFAVLADLHIVPGNSNDSIFPTIREAIDAEKFDFVFVAGDLTNQGNNEEMQAVYDHLSAFTTPYYVVPGNHETTWSESACKIIDQLWGSDRFFVENEMYIFCGLNTGPYMRMSDGHVKAEDLLWLDQKLSQAHTKGKKLVFFSHYPLQDGLGNYRALTSILRKYDCQLAFCGHEHRFKLYNSDSIPQVVCHALRSREGVWGYTSVEISESQAICVHHSIDKFVAKDSLIVNLGYTPDLLKAPSSPKEEPMGGILPRGWKGGLLHQEKASLFTGIECDADQLAYGTSDGQLIVRSINKNRELWRVKTGSGLYSTPLFYKNQLILATTDNRVVSFDRNSGSELWSVPSKTPITGDGRIFAQSLYIGLGSGEFVSINLENGTIDWTFDQVRNNARMQGAPAVTEDVVVFGAWDSYLYCLDRKTGKLNWKWNNGKRVDLIGPGNVAPVVADNRVLLVAPDRYLTILDLKNGETIFRSNQYKVRESMTYCPIEKRAFAKTMDGELISFTFPADGFENLSIVDLGIGYEHNPCPGLVYQGIVYSGSRKGEVVATRAKDNRFLFRVKCGNSSVLRFTPTPDGGVLANLTEGVVWMFKPDDPSFIIDNNEIAYSKGLTGKNIALWPSHGMYYNRQQQRWLWQRARCFGSVEDISIFSYIEPFLAPMLENAGAYVMMPRERDTQLQEIIVDNDHSKRGVRYTDVSRKNRTKGMGYGYAEQYEDGVNPFLQGSAIVAPITEKKKPKITYKAEISAAGEYALYISYADLPNATNAAYAVIQNGKERLYTVDQRKGGGMFHFLGNFYFEKGYQTIVKVTAANPGLKSGVLSSDAIRLGGGMGNIIVDGTISEQPRYAEAARYFMQYTGIPDSIYSPSNFTNDYTDDYKSRGVWVNHLLKKNIPVDAVLAFHTDAGVTPDDRIIGTLAICSTKKGSLQGIMSDTLSKVLSAEIQKQLVKDIRALCTNEWTQRQLWDKPYFEAWTPEVPTLLLELLSHQNLADMRYGLDPRFRFIVSRAIYKSMGRFVTGLRNEPFVVQPLPIQQFALSHMGKKRLHLQWLPTQDILEESACPTHYLIYMREKGKAWQEPILTSETNLVVDLPQYGKRYDFKVLAMNDGGKSQDSEILSAYLLQNQQKPALIVNGFTRIAAPAFFDLGEKAGIAWWEDEGVPLGMEYAFVGYQYDFDRNSLWKSDDAPGWGASGVEGWGKQILGNSFDIPSRHGAAFELIKQSYVSMSRQAFENLALDPTQYALLDIILGEQREHANFAKDRIDENAIFTPRFQQAIADFVDKQVPLLFSGAYIANDLMKKGNEDALDFAKEYLSITPVGGRACQNGHFKPVGKQRVAKLSSGEYNTVFSPDFYRVESPCAIAPTQQSGGIVLYRYTENSLAAGVYNFNRGGQLILGFPFESILSKEVQCEMLQILLQ